MIRVKICGIRNAEDALVCVDAGADAVGFVFHRPSPRSVTPEQARSIVAELPPFVTPVGVFVDEASDSVNEIVESCGLHVAQLHGSETPDQCDAVQVPVVKAFRMRAGSTPPFDAYRGHVTSFLLDTYVKGQPGGTGESFNWALARDAKPHRRIILAGGITAENVSEAIEAAAPDGIDVSSGVESSPGRKDPDKVRALLNATAATWTD